MSTSTRNLSGLYGAFAVRNPTGKALGLVASLLLLFGCWRMACFIAGPVPWADKRLYLRTGWDATIDPLLRGIPILKLGRDESYPVIVERAPGWPLYTNEARAQGKPWAVRRSEVPAKLLHEDLSLYVYRGSFWRQVWPVWLLWPWLLTACLVAGQLVDVRRLRQARQSGVHLRGNRRVELAEWNRGAEEDAR